MAQLAIKGHATRGKEVIEILEMLGGVNAHNLYGDEKFAYYTIDSDKEIKGGLYVFGDEDLLTFTLEEFLEKYSYKVGDKVVAYEEGCLAQFTIQYMRWNHKLNKVEYKICSSWLDDSLIMRRCKEETYTKTRICKLCGKTITYKIRTNDGYDWCGHQRGSNSYEEIGNECNCTEYKRMCLNCKYYDDISKVCNNRKVIEDYNKKIEESFFNIEMTSFIGIKNPTKHCDYWELSKSIAKQVFTK